jgi:pyruvate/2-oxoglutarate dehydrogenase complex dihydrolipoamide acyltransferase (E2) component
MTDNTNLIQIKIPAIGEGLEEARVLKFFKKPGEVIKKDEQIYQLETDKAIVDIESPCAGTLDSWSVAEGAIVAIGAVIGNVRP